MLKSIISLGLSLLALGMFLLLASQILGSSIQSIDVETLLYEERFEMRQEGVRVYNFTFPANVTVMAIIGSDWCVGLKIYNEHEIIGVLRELSVENCSDITELMEKLSKPVSWSYNKYYKHLIPNDEMTTYYFIVYNYPSCYPKHVYLKIGYTTGLVETSKAKPLEFRNQLLSVSLAILALSLLVTLYGFIKETRK